MADHTQVPAEDGALQEVPGLHCKLEGNHRPRIERGASYRLHSSLELDRDDLSEHVDFLEVTGAEFDNKDVKNILKDLAKDHLVNHTGLIDWCKDAPLSVAPPTPAAQTPLVFVDTIVAAVLVPQYYTEPVSVDGDREGERKCSSRIAKYIHSKILEVFGEAGLEVEPRDVQLINGLHELGTPLKAMVSKMTDGGDDEEMTLDVALEHDKVKEERRLLARIRREGAAARSGHPMGGALKIIDQDVHRETPDTKFYINLVKIAPCNATASGVLPIVTCGQLANLGVYHRELDTSMDCAFMFRREEVGDRLVEGGGFRYQHASDQERVVTDSRAYRPDVQERVASVGPTKAVILDNTDRVSHTCLSVMTTSTARFGQTQIQMPEKEKGYVKTVSNLEHRSNRQRDIGWCGPYNGTLCFDRVSRSLILPSTQQRGMVRIENTIFSDGVALDKAHQYTHSDVATARVALEKTLRMFPKELCYDVTHDRIWELYSANIKHVLVVVHSRYDRAILTYSLNEVTGLISGIPINGWSRYYKFVLEKCAFGKQPMDIVTIHTGRDVPLLKPKTSRKKRKSRAISAQEKARRKRSRAGLKDIREMLGPSASASNDREHEDEESEADNESDSESEDEGDGGGEGAYESGGEGGEPRAPSVSTAAPDDQTRYDYKPGWIAPADPLGAVITSQRVIRAPKEMEQVVDGEFFPETRLLADNISCGFSPSGCIERVFHGHEGEEPWPLKPGWNGDGTHKEDVGDRPGRIPDAQWASTRLAEGGMAPNEHVRLNVWPRSQPTKAPKLYHIIACRTRLPIVKLAVLNRRALGEIEKEGMEAQLVRLRASLDSAPAERDATISESTHFMYSHAYKDNVLRAACSAVQSAMGASYDSIPVGTWPVAAIQQRGVTGNAVIKPLTFHLIVDGQTCAFASSKALNTAVGLWATELAPLWNLKGADGKMPCWLSPDVDGLSSPPIGCLTRTDVPGVDSHGRPIVQLTLSVTLPADGSIISIMEQGVATRSVVAAVVVEAEPAVEPVVADIAGEGTNSEPAVDTALPTITMPSPCSRSQFVSLSKLLTPFDNAKCAMVKVLKLGAQITVRNHTVVPMEVELMQPHTQAGVRTVLAGKTIIDLVSSINTEKNTLFVSSNVTSRQVVVAEVVSDMENVWWMPSAASKHAYSALPVLQKQMLSQPTSTVVVAAKRVPNQRRDLQVWIFKMDDGKVYKFSSPQSVVPFAAVLRESNNLHLKLDTDDWTLTAQPPVHCK